MTGAGPIEAIVLAAGAGSRFGGGKLLAPWRDGVLLDGALAAAFASGAWRVIVVTGADAEAVAAATRAWAERAGVSERLVLVHAADHAEGMGASLRTAAAAVSPEAGGVFVFLGDMPKVPPRVCAGLTAAVRSGAAAAAPVCQGRRGHPALFAAELIPGLADLSGDEGARRILAGLGARLVLVETDDPGVLFDVDTPADLS